MTGIVGSLRPFIARFWRSMSARSCRRIVLSLPPTKSRETSGTRCRSETSTLLFLQPRANVRLWEMLQEVVTRLNEPIRSRVHAVAIEDVLIRLCGDQHCPPELRTYAEAMWQKYLLPDAPGT